MPKDALFEERALKKLQSPELLDESVKFVSAPLKLAIGGLGVATVLALTWAIGGKIPEQVVGSAIISDVQNIYQLLSSTSGMIIFNEELLAQNKSRNNHFFELIQKFQTRDDYDESTDSHESLLRRLNSYGLQDEERLLNEASTILSNGSWGGFGARNPPDTDGGVVNVQLDDIIAFIINLQLLQTARDDLFTLSEAKNNYDTTLKEQTQLISIARSNINYLDKSLEASRKAEQVGVISKLTVEGNKNDLIQANSDLINAQTSIRTSLIDLVHAYAQFRSSFNIFINDGVVISPINNLKLRNYSINSGQYIEQGDRLSVGVVRIGKQEPKPDVVTVFMNNRDGQKVKIGQNALVTPNIIEKTQYGGIVGRVISKPKPVISSDQLANMVPYEGFTSYLSNTYEIPVAFQVSLGKTKDKEFKWSGNSVPPYEIREGTTANVSVTTLAKPPISYIIPSIRKIVEPFTR